MVDAGIARFIESRVMILVATRDEAHRPVIARGGGGRYDARTRDFRLLLSRSQWPRATACCGPGPPIATACLKAHNYQAFQITGLICRVGPADADEEALRRRNVETTPAELDRFGVTRLQLSASLGHHDLIRVDFRPRDVFVQTPGPEAGKPLSQVGGGA